MRVIGLKLFGSDLEHFVNSGVSFKLIVFYKIMGQMKVRLISNWF